MRRRYPGGPLSNRLHHQSLLTGGHTCICFEDKREDCGGGGQISGIHENVITLKGKTSVLANGNSFFFWSASIN